MLELGPLLTLGTLRRTGLPGEIVMQREQRQLEAIGHAELVEDVREVVFDRLLADRDLCRDVTVGIAAENHADDLELPRRETELFSARPRMRRREVAQRRGEIGHAFPSYPVLAGHHGANALEQHFAG